MRLFPAQETISKELFISDPTAIHINPQSKAVHRLALKSTGQLLWILDQASTFSSPFILFSYTARAHLDQATQKLSLQHANTPKPDL